MTDRDIVHRQSRRTFLTAAASVGTVGLAGCSGGGNGNGNGNGSGGSDETLTIGYSNFTNGIPFEVMVRLAIEWYAEDQDDIELLSTAGDGSTSAQISDARNLLRQDIDGLIMTPADSNGIVEVVEEAEVPVFSADIPANSEEIGMHVGVNQTDFGAAGAEQLLEAMQETHDTDDLKILEVQMTQDNSNSVLRSQAFNEVIEDSDVATVSEKVVISGFSAEEVTSEVGSLLQSDPELHGAFGNWTGGPLGVMNALEQRDRLVPKGEEGHLPIVSLDGNAAIIDALKEGFVDRVIDQPVMFYGPLALHYMEQYLRNGEDTLPEIGTELTTDSVTIEGGEHQGVDPWTEQHWSPADVREFITFDEEPLDSPFVTTEAPVVTEENADAPYLWGNLSRDI